ncbi:MAG TPA: lectin-like protein [Candidatus Saccharimonadales bacterium]|nr:lectin-like protein [Candidatus Saccharimonadales bacterium]
MQQVLERFKYGAIIVAFICSIVAVSMPPLPAYAAGETITAPASAGVTYAAATPLSVQIAGTGNVAVSIRLYVTHGTLAITNTGGLTLPNGTSGSPLYISGNRNDVNTALATLTMTSTTIGNDELEMSLTAPGEIYFPDTGHMYEVVSSTGTWTAANTAASGLSKYGATGYLATMTSDEENTFVADRLTTAGWMGASDSAIEGDWKWVNGPESGTSFWSGTSTGSPVGGQYENWGSGEPNNAGNEDCAQFLSGGSGEWNDLPCTVTTLPAYVVEYGAPGALPAVESDTMAITVAGATRHLTTCADLQVIDDIANSMFDTFILDNDIDCSGISNFAPLGSGGTAWNDFMGTFDGNGHTISNLTVNNPNNDAGLFQRLDGAIVKDLTLHSGSVTAAVSRAGAVAGDAEGSFALQNITSDVYVTANSMAGGLVGRAFFNQGMDSTITNVHVSGDISTTSNGGGLIGQLALYDSSELTVTIASSTGTVESTARAGGLFGHVYIEEDVGDTGLTVRDVYSSATVEAVNAAGGIAGLAEPFVSGGVGNAYIKLERVYTSGSITATTAYAGGLFAYLNTLDSAGEIVTINDSFVAGAITSPSDDYALFYSSGVSAPGVVNSNDVYVDRTRTSQNTNSNVTLTGVTGVNVMNAQPNYFFNTTTSEPLDEWNFSSGTVWYKHLQTFPTFVAITDEDADGAPSSSEDAGPNGGDGNNDGILDSVQSNVVSFVSGLSSKPVAIEASSGCSFSSMAMRSESQFAAKDGGYDYPQGFVKFTAGCGTPGFTANIKLFFYDVNKGGLDLVRKYNSVRDAYFVLPGSTVSGQTIGGRTVTIATYHVTDGSELDEDAAANGTILDPAGLAQNVVGVPNTGLGGSVR